MLSIFVETSCNRYNRDECITCHVYEPLMEHPVSDWHLTVEQARKMAEKIKKIETLNTLAQQEINLTGGEASQNPDIVEICKVFQTVTPHVCLHTNLDILSEKSKVFKSLSQSKQCVSLCDKNDKVKDQGFLQRLVKQKTP